MLCWLHRISVGQALDAGRPVSGRLGRHLAECPGCQAFHAAHTRMVSRLGAEARMTEEPPAFLHGKIMARIRRAEREPTPTRRLPIWVAAMAGLILVAGLLDFTRGLPKHQPTVARVAPGPQPAQVTTTDAVVIPPGLQVWSTNWSRPLEAELQALIQDAKSAVTVVALNFLPPDDAPEAP